MKSIVKQKIYNKKYQQHKNQSDNINYTFQQRFQKSMYENPKYKTVHKGNSDSLSWWQSFSSTITNIRYDAKKTYVELKQRLFQPEEDYQLKQIIIQGKRHKNRKQAKEAVRKILWFSYRRGFNIKNEYKSDVGWGCLIRVGQMALASALIKYFQQQNQMLNLINSESDLQNLIAAFSDVEGPQQKYSLNKIVQIAAQQFKQKPGEWFDLTRISYCLSTLQNKKPMRGSSGLKLVFLDQCVNVNLLFKIYNLPICKCVKQTVICERCHSQIKLENKQASYIKNNQGKLQSLIKKSSVNHQPSSNSISMKKNKISLTGKGISNSIHQNKCHKNTLQVFKNKILSKDLYLLILTRVGDRENADRVNKAIFSLLDLSFCLGIMTGFPKQAIFVVGRQGSKLIYLNPHYVQQNQSLDMSNKNSNFCNEYLMCQRTKLDPSMAFCFYMQNMAQLQMLVQTISNVNLKYPDSLSIGVDYKWSHYDCTDYQEEDDDNFSVLSFQSTFRM